MTARTPARPRPRPGKKRSRYRLLRFWQDLTPRGRLLVAGVPAGVFFALFAFLGYVYASADIPEPGEVELEQSAEVLYADGSRFGVISGDENRVLVDLDDIPKDVREAVLAAEDEGFYGHSGVSPTGIVRAVWASLRGGGTQGGSTITQQYVKTAFLTRERTVIRKLREVAIAVKLERTYSKDEILEFYLNTIYFGRGAYGIEAASRTYFGRPVHQLNVAQGAFLATLIRAPEGGDPARNPKLADRRWRAVIDNMVEEGWLDDADGDRLKFPAVRPRGAAGVRAQEKLGGQKGFLYEEIQRELEAAGFNLARLRRGVRIRTTIDPKAQAAAERAVPSVLTSVPRDLRTALVAVEPGTGRIRAMYGGRDYLQKQFNFAVQAERQPGSSFKPYVLAAAIDEGIGLRSRYDGRSPQTFGGDDYEVDNFDNESFGQIDLVEATAKSVNTVYVGLAEDVGPRDIIDMARRAGIPEDRKLPADLSLALGTGDVTPLDQATAFATFAAGGTRAAPYVVELVSDRENKTLYRVRPNRKRTIDADVCADVLHAMRQGVEHGTGQRAQLDGQRPAAGKTGTTQANTDAWFVGVTPQLSAAVWMGFDDPKRKLVGIQGRTVTGGTFPAPIWKAFMDAALEGKPARDFPAPAFAGRDRDPAPASTAPAPTPTAVPSTVVPTVVPTTAPPSPTRKPSKSPDPTTEPTTEPTSEPSPSASPSAAQT